MRGFMILVMVSVLTLVAGKKHCIKSSGSKKCNKLYDSSSQSSDSSASAKSNISGSKKSSSKTSGKSASKTSANSDSKDKGKCDVANGFVCMTLPKGNGSGKSGKTHTICAEPQAEGCWCDPSLTSSEACEEGLTCQLYDADKDQYKCQNDTEEQCNSDNAWNMTYHHGSNGEFINGSRDTLLQLLKSGADVKVWTLFFGVVNVQKVTVSYSEDDQMECANGQALFLAFPSAKTYNLYVVFSTSGNCHLTQFYINDPVNKVRVNRDIMLEMKWYTRKASINVTDESRLIRRIQDGAHVRAGFNNTFRPLEVVEVTGDGVEGLSVYEFLDRYNGMAFYPDETRLLKLWSFDGSIIEGSGLLHQPDSWNISRELSGEDLSWLVDPCWKAVYRHNENGVAQFGNKQTLNDAIESGKRLRLRIGCKFYEPNVVSQVGGDVIAVVFDSVDRNVASGTWNWLQVYTTGSVKSIKVIIGGTDVTASDQYSEVTWFVETRDWTMTTSADLNDKIISGADVRFSIPFGNEVKWYQADFALKSIVGRNVFMLYSEREVAYNGTGYVQRFTFVNWNTPSFTYQDYPVGHLQMVSEELNVPSNITFFTNAVV